MSKHFHIMTSTGPMMLDSVIRLQACNTLGYMPRVRFSAHDFNEKHAHEGARVKHDAILIPLPGSSWCGYDSHIFNCVNAYKTELAVTGAILIILVVILMFVFIYRYFKSRNMLNRCRQSLGKCSAR